MCSGRARGAWLGGWLVGCVLGLTCHVCVRRSYQRVINKTKDLSFRSYLLASGLERALHESSRRKNKAARNNKDAGKEASA